MDDRSQNKGALYLIPNVLYENTQDLVITPQVRAALETIDHLFVENVRTARRFIASLKIARTIDSFAFEVVDKRTGRMEAAGLLRPLLEGKNGGIISEAGCPGIADPGSVLVDAAHRNDIDVIPLTGPSSIFLALMASGFNGQKFCFHGYLPIDKEQRTASVKRLEKNATKYDESQIFMETPYRNNALLKDLLNACSNASRLCIAKSLTGKNEWIKTRTVGEWKKDIPDLHKEPVIFILYKP